MTNEEFMNIVLAYIDANPLLGTRKSLTLNALIFILREKMELDCSLSSSDGVCIPTTHAFVPTRHLALHVTNIEWYNDYNCVFFDFIEERS